VKSMSNSRALVFCCLSVGALGVEAAGQNTNNELRPELGIYVQQGPTVRIVFVDSARGDQSTDIWQVDFTFYVEAALKPIFRRGLRDQPNVYRNKYLTFRAGYRYRTSLTEGNSSENRGILEITSRYRLPGQLVISDRNRGEFRFIQGQPFSTRYRNRLRLERDIEYSWINFTPYIYDEIFYDTRYSRWARNQYALGLEFPIGRHIVLEPYYLRQNNRPPNLLHVNAFGFKLNLYF